MFDKATQGMAKELAKMFNVPASDILIIDDKHDPKQYAQCLDKLESEALSRYLANHPNKPITGDRKMKTGNFIIGTIDHLGRFSVTATPYQHASRVGANKEAERLAKLSPNKSFIVLQISGACKAQTVSWT